MWVTGSRRPSIVRTPTHATLKGIPEGIDGVAATLREMRDYARASVRAPDQKVRTLALDLVRLLPERNWFAEICALHAFVRDRIRYVRDPEGVELVQQPEKTLEFGQGDCDDKVTLLASLLTAIGHPAELVAVGFRGGPPFEHVLVQSLCGRKWVPLETIPWVDGTHKPCGWYPPGVVRRYVLKV